MDNEETPPTDQTPPPAPQPTPTPTPGEAPAGPPATNEVLDGRITEETAQLRRDIDRRDRELRDRESKLAEREARLQRQRAAAAAPEKSAWLSGNALVD